MLTTEWATLPHVPEAFMVARGRDPYNRLCTKDDADFVLFEMAVGDWGTYRRHVLVGHTSVPLMCIYIKALDATAMYLHVSTDVRPFNQEQLARLSRIQYGHDLFPYGLVSQDDILNHALHANRHAKKLARPGLCKQYPKVLEVLDGTVTLPRPKVSASHLNHITVNELSSDTYSWMLANFQPALNLLEHLMSDMHESFFVGLLVWCRMLPDVYREKMIGSDIWWWEYKSVMDFSKTIKANFTSRLKALQNVLYLDLSPLFEFEVLVNRGLGGVDWQQEETNRVKPTLVNIAKGDVYSHACRLFTQCKDVGGRPQRMPWNRYWSRRWEWAPTGSFHSQHAADMEYRAKTALLRNKFYATAAYPEVPIDHFLSRPKTTVAWPSVKYEWGKQRAIYGVDFTNFVLSGFGMAGCEQVLSKMLPLADTATEDSVAKTVAEVLRNGVPYCFDFEDFNSQHSTSSMQAVLEAYLHVFKERLSDEQIEAIQWSSTALANTYVLRADGSNYTTNGTLLSGWRLTTFVNTVLNWVYIKEAMGDRELTATHSGDDILAAVTDYSQLQTLNKGARRLGIRFQPSKCYLGAIAEFLRVDHRAKNGSQYLCRAVATFVHSAIETKVPNDLRSVIEAIQTRANELVSRGAKAEVVKNLAHAQFAHIAKEWNIGVEEIYTLLETHLSRGGVSSNINHRSLANSVLPQVIRGYTDVVDPADFNRELPGAVKYAQALTEHMIAEQYFGKILTQLRRAIFNCTLLTKTSIRNTRALYSGNNRVGVNECAADFQLRSLHANQYGMYRGTYHGTKVVLAKTYGIPLLSIEAKGSTLARRIAEESDWRLALRVWL